MYTYKYNDGLRLPADVSRFPTIVTRSVTHDPCQDVGIMRIKRLISLKKRNNIGLALSLNDVEFFVEDKLALIFFSPSNRILYRYKYELEIWRDY